MFCVESQIGVSVKTATLQLLQLVRQLNATEYNACK